MDAPAPTEPQVKSLRSPRSAVRGSGPRPTKLTHKAPARTTGPSPSDFEAFALALAHVPQGLNPNKAPNSDVPSTHPASRAGPLTRNPHPFRRTGPASL